jgi:hypothetical protein
MAMGRLAFHSSFIDHSRNWPLSATSVWTKFKNKNKIELN